VAAAAVLQIEYSPSLLSLRRSILERAGYGVISVLGTADALAPSLPRQSIGVIVIGHGASWYDRPALISHFRGARVLAAQSKPAVFRHTETRA